VARSVVRPPTTERIVGSTRSHSASLRSSYPARRLKRDWRSSAVAVC
jgi:hypothetical protein